MDLRLNATRRSINSSVYLVFDLEAGRFKFLSENILGAFDPLSKLSGSQPLWFVIFVFWAFHATTDLPFIRRSQGSTLVFRPLSTRRRFVSRKSIRSEFLSPTVKVLWSLHPHKCLSFENPRTLRWKRAFSIADSTIASFCGTLWYRDWTRPWKRLGPKVEFCATQGDTVN